MLVRKTEKKERTKNIELLHKTNTSEVCKESETKRLTKNRIIQLHNVRDYMLLFDNVMFLTVEVRTEHVKATKKKEGKDEIKNWLEYFY